mmetsp:Transcript_24337/g.78149  ORF Transcript_24337/g.78149 Transcript_24337/m.78149 type:complete len:229 (-) Transcript_24337:121-807(-)
MEVATKVLKTADAASAVRYSGCPPGADAPTRSSSTIAAHASSTLCASHGRPTSAAAALRATTTVGARPPNAKHVSATTYTPPAGCRRTRSPAVTMEMSSSRRRACLYGRTKSSGAQCGTKKETITAEVMKERGRWLVPAPLTSTAIFDVRRSGASSVECDVRPAATRRELRGAARRSSWSHGMTAPPSCEMAPFVAADGTGHARRAGGNRDGEPAASPLDGAGATDFG